MMSDDKLARALIRAALVRALKDHDAHEGEYLIEAVRALLDMPTPSPTIH